MLGEKKLKHILTNKILSVLSRPISSSRYTAYSWSNPPAASA